MVLFESGLIMIGGRILSTLIGDTSTKVVSVLETALQFQHTDVHNVFVELDLEVRLAVIGSLINQITKEQHNKPIEICLKAIHDITVDINSLSEDVEEKIQEHSEKYFNGWRSIDFDIEIGEIRKKSDLLEKRFEMLLNLLKVEPKESL